MDFGLSDPQTLLQSSIRDFLAQHVPIERVREVMESSEGVDREIHRQLGDQGIAGLLVPEEHGGAELELLDAVVAAQELGRGAAPVSFHTAFVMAPLLLAGGGSAEQKAEWLPGIAEGTRVVTVALGDIRLKNGQLHGTATFVPDAHCADAFLVAADTDGGTRLVLVPSGTPGVAVEMLRTVDDTRRVAEVTLDGTKVSDDMLLPGENQGDLLQRVLDAGRIALAADALAAAYEGLRIAVDYAKQREQFNRIVASYQAVKHMCAETIAEVDPVQSLVWYTAYAWDQGLEEATHLAPIVKAHATETASHAVATTTQVFGGIGFTDECDMQIYFKRAGYDRQMLGGPTEMRELAARLQFPS